MNNVMIAGTLTGEPKQVKTKSGRFRYWFSLTVNDGRGGKPEIVEVVGMRECARVLYLAAMRGQQVMVYGSIHTCDGTDLEAPGKHRFVRADDIVPIGAVVTAEINSESIRFAKEDDPGEDIENEPCAGKAQKPRQRPK